MRIEKYKSTDKKEWDSFIENSLVDCFLFKRDYLEYHSERFVDYSLMIYDEKSVLLCLVPANFVNNSFFTHKGLTFGGFLFKKSLTSSKIKDIVDSTINFLSSKNFNRIHIKDLPEEYQLNKNHFVNYYIRNKYKTIIEQIPYSVINFNNEINLYRRKKSIKLAQKKSVEIEFDSDITQFWNKILIPNLIEKYSTSPVHTVDEIVKLKESFPKEIILVSAFYESQIVAGILLYVNQGVIKTQYISSNKLGRSVSALDLIMSEIISHYKDTHNFFDLGSSSSNDGKTENINYNLLKWKDAFDSHLHIQELLEIVI
jgi:hypothetical protein